MSAQRETVPSATFWQYFRDSALSKKTSKLFAKRYKKPFNMKMRAFNNAVSLLNLKKWRSEDKYLQAEYEFWMTAALNMKNLSGFPWWHMSSQSIMWFTYRENVTKIPIPRWHREGLGWRVGKTVTKKMAKEAKLLHWSGADKPWTKNSSAYHTSFWTQNMPGQCNDKDSCLRQLLQFQECFIILLNV